ncbi:ABC transporter permease [Lentzea sp. NBRC 105346]|uniref:ABC transporter permease n=1 Tax=Lentzea sp. NBRC 105346 TaxID=3032205 RepID=UPI0024A1F673|nr:ABC transporter permease [Lentzea sp. NBRC 105346]GLZ29062.1 ABC transporter permease [Lentzea sp. NBRC 105346]
MTGFAAATRLVAEREIGVLVRTKGFWIGYAVTIIGLFAITVLPAVLDSGPPKVAAVGSDVATSLAGKDLDVRTVGDLATAQDLVRKEEVQAAIVRDPSPTGVRVIALYDPPRDVVTRLATAPPVDLLEAAAVSTGERQLVITVFALVFVLFAMGGAAIAQSTVTEKQTRIVEILVSTIPVRALLAGKIAAHTLLTLGQVVVLALVTPIAMRLGGQAQLLAVVQPALGWFIPFVVLGFVLLAGIWAVTGSLVSRQEDLGSSMGVVMILVMGPYILVQAFFDNAAALAVMSYVPFSAPVAMPVRMFAGQAHVWEALLSLGVLAGSVVVIVLLASRVYSGALLQTRGKVKLAKAWAHAD